MDNDAVEIGMPVEMVTRKMRNDGDKRGLIVYGYKFRPAPFIPTKKRISSQLAVNTPSSGVFSVKAYSAPSLTLNFFPESLAGTSL